MTSDGRERRGWKVAVGLALGLWAAVAAGQEQPAAETPDWGAVTEGSLAFRSPVTGRFELVPLERTDVAIDVRGLVAAATVTQRFENPSDRPIEAVYVFPLPHDATVYDLEARVGERVIRSQIKERQEAQRIYAAARAEGRRAALVEQALGHNPFGDALYLFINRRRDKLKALYWHRNGFCLWYKRLEAERFAWPEAAADEATCVLTAKELEWLLEGFDLWAAKPHKTLNFQSVT